MHISLCMWLRKQKDEKTMFNNPLLCSFTYACSSSSLKACNEVGTSLHLLKKPTTNSTAAILQALCTSIRRTSVKQTNDKQFIKFQYYYAIFEITDSSNKKVTYFIMVMCQKDDKHQNTRASLPEQVMSWNSLLEFQQKYLGWNLLSMKR